MLSLLSVCLVIFPSLTEKLGHIRFTGDVQSVYLSNICISICLSIYYRLFSPSLIEIVTITWSSNVNSFLTALPCIDLEIVSHIGKYRAMKAFIEKLVQTKHTSERHLD